MLLFSQFLVLLSCLFWVVLPVFLHLRPGFVSPIGHYLQVVFERHLLEDELVVEQLIAFQERVHLRQYPLEQQVTAFQELQVLSADGLGVYNFFLLSGVVNCLRDELEYLLRVSEGLVQPLGPIDKVEGMLSRRLLQMLEDAIVVDVCHLLRQFPDGVLAMPMQVVQRRLLTPVIMILLLQQLLHILHLRLRQHFNVALAS